MGAVHTSGGMQQQRRLPPDEALPTGVATLRLTGADPTCGFVCCPPKGVRARDRDRPLSLSDIYTQEEWSSLTAAVDDAFTSSAFPAFPCSFTVLCLPCLPLCVMCHRASQRRRKLECVAAQENARLLPQGLEWILTPNRQRNMNMVAVLRWNPDRLEFEAANPHRRPVSREPPPIGLLPPDLREQLAIVNMAPQVFAMQAQLAAAKGMVPPQSGMGMGMGAPAAPLAPAHQFMEMSPYPQQQQSQFGQQQSSLIYAHPSAPSAYDEQTYAPPAYSGGPLQPAAQAGASGVLHVRAAATVASAPVVPAPHSDSAADNSFSDASSGEGMLQSRRVLQRRSWAWRPVRAAASSPSASSRTERLSAGRVLIGGLIMSASAAGGKARCRVSRSEL